MMKMNLKTVLLLVCVPLILSGSIALAHTDVTPEQAHELIGSTDDLIVVDVREPSEYCDTRGHIPSAVNYPLTSGVLYDRYEELPKNGPILAVCRSGSRSNQAANFLDSQGFSMVYDMTGGMNSWIWETEPCGQHNEKYSGGTGEPNDPYIITDVNELQGIQHDLSACYALGNDIDASATKTWNDGAGFDPIGWRIDINNYEAFTGKFNGRGYIIFDLFINRPFTDYVGLFGLILDGAEVKNVGLADANITARGSSGSLVGYSNGATLSDSWSTGIVKGSYNGQMRLGGLIGRSTGENSFVTRCFSNATVIATGGAHQVGGLAGYNGHGSIMSDCYATGDVSGYWKVGGLVGDNIDGSEGTVIQRCYSIGKVNSHFGGGLVGFNWLSGITIDSYWNIETSGQTTSAGGIGKTTAEMHTASTFLEAGWDFVGETDNGTEDIWSICEGTNYPRFVWQIPAVDFVCPDGITIDDFSFFMERWLDDNCNSSNGYCDGTDLDQSGTVDATDLEIFFENWLAEDSVNN